MRLIPSPSPSHPHCRVLGCAVTRIPPTPSPESGLCRGCLGLGVLRQNGKQLCHCLPSDNKHPDALHPAKCLRVATRSRMGSFEGLSSRSGFLQPWRRFARINGWRSPRGERGGCESPRADLQLVFRLIQDLPFNLLDFSSPNSAECILKLKTSQSPKCFQIGRAHV